jgi:hypothetical protein
MLLLMSVFGLMHHTVPGGRQDSPCRDGLLVKGPPAPVHSRRARGAWQVASTVSTARGPLEGAVYPVLCNVIWSDVFS